MSISLATLQTPSSQESQGKHSLGSGLKPHHKVAEALPGNPAQLLPPPPRCKPHTNTPSAEVLTSC